MEYKHHILTSEIVKYLKTKDNFIFKQVFSLLKHYPPNLENELLNCHIVDFYQLKNLGIVLTKSDFHYLYKSLNSQLSTVNAPKDIRSKVPFSLFTNFMFEENAIDLNQIEFQWSQAFVAFIRELIQYLEKKST